MTQYVLITAGGSGLGLAMASAFLAEGAEVAITDNDGTMLKTAKEKHPNLLTLEADASDADAMCAHFDTLMQRWGRLDVLLANAGSAGPTAPIEDIALTDWQRCVAVNLEASFIAAKLATPIMKAQKSGGHYLDLIHGGAMGLPHPRPLRRRQMGGDWFDENFGDGIGGIRGFASCDMPGVRWKVRASMGSSPAAAQARGIDADEMRQDYTDCASMRRFIRPPRRSRYGGIPRQPPRHVRFQAWQWR